MNTVGHSKHGNSLRVAFVGGGSGGHIFPAVAIAQELLRQDPKSCFLFLTSHRVVDQQVLGTSGLSEIEAQVVPYASLSSKRGLWNSAMRLPSLWRSLRQARRCLKAFRPDVVVGLGALASVPGVVAANRLGLPLMLLEQNCLPGRATKRLARHAKLTVCGLPVAKDCLQNWASPVQTCGSPVRVGIRELAAIPVGAIPERKRILILGGSQGSHAVNQIVATAFGEGLKLPSEWDIVHQTGEPQVAAIRDQYCRCGIVARVEAFLSDMQAELAAASIAVSRSGAVTIQELACAGVPSILIPLSTAADHHQLFNARLLENAGAAFLIAEKHLDAVSTFRASLESLLSNPDVWQRMAQAIRSFAAPNAALEIVGLLRDVARSKD
ncbi:MAG: UDP-N-acetylglucosamine--N-acetylmuramyl-(pentapeptide) pyrophosphoryl-undecaprenol N-acetylglucosamine transferase [Planctomycetota bacterium]|nr:MAG: UDP-N-acetylglucosamine--N-acetylmuramyl-(pentapeptide) pyrophosphoryl-undecaprenol N-acetylglucosamine transferase [Planctomycetota bacterium]